MDIQTINKRLASGFLSLTFSQAFLLALNYLTINIFLARILPVETIGIFNIGNTFLSIFTFFSDIGLAAALIQKKEITKDDLKSTFFVQEILAFLIAVFIWFSAPRFASLYNFGADEIWLIRALGISFLLSSFKVIPSILLERELKFVPLVIVTLIETLFYNTSLIILSLMNLSINAFSYSALLRGIVGVVAVYSLFPWRIEIGFSKSAIKSLLTFGVPFQLNTILALTKDRLVPLIIAHIVGPVGFGLITWAQNLALMPILLVTNLIRLTFPTFSRLQDDKALLKNYLERAVFLTGLFSYPLIFGLIAISPSLVEHIVTDKWRNALPLIYLFSINTFLATISTTFTNFLNAIGKIGITLKLMIMWTILTWILSPYFATTYGFLGVGFASAIIAVTSLIPIFITKKIIKVEIFKNTYQPLLASVGMAIITYALANQFAKDMQSTIIIILIGGFVYLLFMILLSYKKTIMAIKGVMDVNK